MKYRIWNNKEKKYETNLFLSQDGTKLMKEGWLAVPLTDDFKVEQGIEIEEEGTFYENDIVYYWSYEEVGVVELNDEGEFWIGSERLGDLYDISLAGNTNENTLEEFLLTEEELEEIERDYIANMQYDLWAGK